MSITLEVIPPHWDGAPYTFDLLTNPPSPDVSGNYAFDYVPSDFGLETITSGIWSFKLIVVDADDVTLTSSLTVKLFFGEIANGIRQDFLTIDERNLSAYTDRLSGYLMLVGATWNARCGKASRAQDQIDWLYKNLEDCNC